MWESSNSSSYNNETDDDRGGIVAGKSKNMIFNTTETITHTIAVPESLQNTLGVCDCAPPERRSVHTSVLISYARDVRAFAFGTFHQ